jgi:hypothetical protein
MTNRVPEKRLPMSQNAIQHRSSVAVLWCLRIVIVIQCVGIAGRYVLSTYESESDVYGLLYFDLGWPEKVAQLIDDVGGWGCLVSAVVLVVNGCVSDRNSLGRGLADHAPAESRLCFIVDAIVLIFVATWTISLGASHMIRGELYAELALGELAVRFFAPIGLLLLLQAASASSRKLMLIATGLLTVAAAMTFAVHGYKAIQQYGPFVDLILLSDNRIFGIGPKQATTESILLIIGWTDIVVAALLLATRWRVVAAYMFLWGLITAFSRMTALGMVAWPETLIRSANAGVPLVLWFLYQNRFSARSPRIST